MLNSIKRFLFKDAIESYSKKLLESETLSESFNACVERLSSATVYIL